MQKQTLNPTRNDLPLKIRHAMVNLLNQVLADSSDLYSQVKQAHWNIKGLQFMQIHLLLDKLAEEIEENIDEIAERLTALGGIARGTSKMVSSASRLPDYPEDILAITDHLEALVDAYAFVSTSLRAAIDEADEDAGTADLLTQTSRSIDKSLWILESHLMGDHQTESSPRIHNSTHNHRRVHHVHRAN